MNAIIDENLQWLCIRAQSGLECSTTSLWEYYFNRVAFSEPIWIVSSQQPQVEFTRERVDIVVEGRIHASREVSTLLFFEAKKQSATGIELETAETDTYKKAIDYLTYYKFDSVYTMTCFGTYYRLWVLFVNDDYMTDFYPIGAGLSDKTEYLELSTSREELAKAFDFIKMYPCPTRESTDLFRASLGQPEELGTYSTATGYNLIDWPNTSADIYATQSYLVTESDLYIDANLDKFVTIIEVDERFVRGTELDGKAHMLCPTGDWRPARVDFQGIIEPCFAYRAEEGYHWWTWTMTVEVD